jgi:hypothetical protein
VRLFPQRTADFGYLEIFDLYSKKELEKIWREISHLLFISDIPSVKTDRRGSSATTYEKNPKVKYSGDGLHLDGIYARREYSSILTYNRKIFTNKKILKSFEETHPSNTHYKSVRSDFTIFNRYRNSQGYLPHTDQASFTSITIMLQSPEKMKGGDLVFPDYNITITPKDNYCVLFPSWVNHGVTPLSCKGDAMRYSIANLSHMRI